MLRLRSRNALAALLLLALAPACPDAAPEGPPDVYLIVIDTLRADRLSCYGYPRTTSPFLDELAAEGALFLDNTSQSSWTKPSMVSLMSGAYVTAYRDVMPDGVPSLAQSFQDAGYHTIGVVGNVLLSTKLGFDRGFDHYDAREITDAEREEMRARGLREPVCRPVALMLEELAPHLDAEFERRAAGQHRPMLTYLHPMEPHDPYERNAQYERELPNADVDGQGPHCVAPRDGRGPGPRPRLRGSRGRVAHDERPARTLRPRGPRDRRSLARLLRRPGSPRTPRQRRDRRRLGPRRGPLRTARHVAAGRARGGAAGPRVSARSRSQPRRLLDAHALHPLGARRPGGPQDRGGRREPRPLPDPARPLRHPVADQRAGTQPRPAAARPRRGVEGATCTPSPCSPRASANARRASSWSWSRTPVASSTRRTAWSTRDPTPSSA